MELNTLAMVHDFLRHNVREGDFCIDATAGRGRDTALLCRLAGKSGTVYSFDIQQDAIRQTKELLDKEALNARLILDSHEHLLHYSSPGTVDCIVFNFGRLPGGDPMIMTRADSSVAAIQAGLTALKPGGFMVLALYYGKENGYSEKNAILAFLKTIDDRAFSVLSCDWLNRRNDPPMPIFIWKERENK